MAGRVHLVRHAEGLHNLRQDLNIADAQLTHRGLDFAEALGRQFVQNNTDSVGAIFASPLRRTIETSLEAFHRVLSSAHYPNNSGKGARTGGVSLVLNPDLQEISDYPCNTGSRPADLLAEFPELESQIQSLPPKWFGKEGDWEPTDQAVAARRTRILKLLWNTSQQLQSASDPEQKKRTDIVVVTHEGIILKLVPNTNIPIASYKTFTLAKDPQGKISLI
jgi:broad specificity phosphatase PhoE